MKRTAKLSLMLGILCLAGCATNANDLLVQDCLDFNTQVLPNLEPRADLSDTAKEATRKAVQAHIDFVNEVANGN